MEPLCKALIANACTKIDLEKKKKTKNKRKQIERHRNYRNNFLVPVA